jgi:hypothetical protein
VISLRPRIHISFRWFWATGRCIRFLFVTCPMLLVWHWPRRGISAVYRGVVWCLRWVWAFTCAQGRLIKASPFAFYRAMTRRRDWVLAKVEYIHSESAKFRALWTALKLPYTGLRAMGLNPQTCIGLLAVGTTAGTGAIVNETLLAERSFSRGDSGVYSAPLDVPTSYTEGDNTLLVQLSSVPVGTIWIDSISTGTIMPNSVLPSGQTNVLEIGGTAASEGFTATWLEVGHLIIDRWRCSTFEMSDVETHTLEISGVAADGISISAVPGIPRRRGISGGNRAEDMTVRNSTYDQIRIEAPTSGVNGQVDVLRLSNIQTKGGPCLVSRVKSGVITIELLVVGNGDGLGNKDFVIKDTVVYKVATISDNVEELISPPS